MIETKLKASVGESRLQTTCSCPWLKREWGAGTGTKQDSEESRPPLESHLAYHLRCLWEDATDLERVSLEPLALVRHRVRRIRGIREELVNSQSTGTSSSTRNRTVKLVRIAAAVAPQLWELGCELLRISEGILQAYTAACRLVRVLHQVWSFTKPWAGFELATFGS